MCVCVRVCVCVCVCVCVRVCVVYRILDDRFDRAESLWDLQQWAGPPSTKERVIKATAAARKEADYNAEKEKKKTTTTVGPIAVIGWRRAHDVNNQ